MPGWLTIDQKRRNSVEIERKWMVKDWPAAELPLVKEQLMRQGYVTVRPTVRIREEAEVGGKTDFVLCFKSISKDNGLSRKEIELNIPEDKFAELEDLIGLPLIKKVRKTYRLPDGLLLEVNQVDEGLPTEFWYAEVEFESTEQAKKWNPESCGLGDYLSDDVTSRPDSSMGAYWVQTRLGGKVS